MRRTVCSRATAASLVLALAACTGYLEESELASPDEIDADESSPRYVHVPDEDVRERATDAPPRVRDRPQPRSDRPPRSVATAVVGRTVEIGCGRAFVWGDEHVGFDEYWPASGAFWREAIEWLADGRDCGITRTRAVFWTGAPAKLRGELAGIEIVESGMPEAGDILVVAASTALDPVWLREWIDGGGALMMTVVGYGDAPSEECDAPNASLRRIGLAYECGRAPPWSGVVFAVEHPIGRRLEAVNGPFVNGRWVVDVEGTSRVVAWIDAGR